ncbi:transglutaminase domain-containing protein [Tannockella kyphosi]|uniref:transglutaminase domain-containing protein n=1 Tax=Tannockella kyphosi TaxID=2899121 RepID=UPI002013A09A|nr:transglutaminase domain-containing protein [Tannockella kyphosi]
MEPERREKKKISVIIAKFIMFIIKIICIMTVIAVIGVTASNLLDNEFDMNTWIEEMQTSYQSIESLDYSLFEEKEEVFEEDLEYWAYSTLSQDEQKIYLLMAEAIINLEPNISFKTKDITEDDITKIWNCIRSDFYEAEYVETISVKRSDFFSTTNCTIVFDYRYDTEEIEIQKEEAKQVVQEAISGIDGDATDYEKVKAVYEYIVFHVEYEFSDYDQTSYGALVKQEAVCAGYARAMQYILNEMGISCTFISGTTSFFESEEGHGWNLVLIEDEYYYVDVTWGDPNYSSDENASLLAEQINYDYLLVTEEDIASNHYADDYFELPEVTATQYNFFVVEGLVVDTYSESRLVEIFKNPVVDNYYVWKTSDSEIYNQIIWNINNDDLISKVVNQANITGASSYIWISNDEMNSFTMILIYE